MHPCPPSLRPLAILSIALLAAVRADAELATTSPFLPTPVTNAATPTAGAPLEFRGSMEGSDGVRVRIYDPARKVGAWVRLNERDPNLDFVVKQYDADRQTVSGEYQGRPLTLAQHEAKIISSGAGMPNMMNVPQPQNPMPAAIANSVVVNPTPADEQRRLDAVATEVARRRAFREQATQQVNAGMPVAPQVIQQALRFQPQNSPPNNPPQTSPGLRSRAGVPNGQQR